MQTNNAFSGYSVDDLGKAKEFYGVRLGLETDEEPEPMPMLNLKFANGGKVLIYPKDNHTPASFTVLNFPVDDIDVTIDELTQKGVQFERYDNLPAQQDEKGVLRGKAAGMGPDIAWFKDPAGNILAILSN
ncbi:MAG: VOC family protein [bacterium]|nr:VOC family protein [bacterium]